VIAAYPVGQTDTDFDVKVGYKKLLNVTQDTKIEIPDIFKNLLEEHKVKKVWNNCIKSSALYITK
jgi:hypothetical protein